jgi:uncharacterized protein
LEVKGDYKFKAPPDKVWRVLTSFQALEKALPGCESLVETESGHYDVTLKLGIASIKGTYHGRIRMEDIQEPTHYKLVVEGNSAQGYLNGEGIFDISTEGEGDKLKTVVTYHGIANVGGTLASVGARLLSPIAKLLIGNFFKSMEKQIAEGEANSQQQSQ